MTAETVTVSVTQQHIDRGTPGECSRCPIALAFFDAMPDLVLVMVRDACEARADLFSGDVRSPVRSAALPAEATDFIIAFDIVGPGSAVPFTFTAEVTGS